MRSPLLPLLMFFYVGFCFGQARLLKDLNTTPNSYSGKLITVGNYVCFTSNQGSESPKWWITDGITLATHVINQSDEGSESLTAATSFNGDFYYFKKLQAKHQLIKFHPESGALQVIAEFENLEPIDRAFIRSSDYLLFLVSSGSEAQIWKSDGSSLGTSKVASISDTRHIEFAEDDNGTLTYFITRDYSQYVEDTLWRTDGTQDGTFEIQLGGATGRFSSLFVTGNEAFLGFTDAGKPALWKSNGTSANTVQVSELEYEIVQGFSRMIGTTLLFNDVLLFASNGVDKTEKLFNGYVTWIDMYHGAYYFLAYDFDSRKFVLGKTDGTAAGTEKLRSLSSLSANASLLSSHDKILISDRTSEGKQMLFLTDGNPDDTQIIKTFDNGGVSRFVNVGPKTVFLADDGTHGLEPWITDGTLAGTKFIIDTDSGTGDSWGNEFSISVHPIGDRIIFDARSLWWTDGTEAGTSKVSDETPTFWIGSIGNEMYYDAFSNIFSINITTGASRLVKSFEYYGSASYFLPNTANLVNNKLIYRIGINRGGTNVGIENWVTDGTADGSHVLKDINPGPNSTFIGLVAPDLGIVIGDQYLFGAYEPENGVEPWVTDGTEEGTKLLLDLAPGPERWSKPQVYFSLKGKSFFIANGADFRPQLFTTDLTAEGTIGVVAIDNSGVFSDPVVFDDLVFFASGGLNRHQLSIR